MNDYTRFWAVTRNTRVQRRHSPVFVRLPHRYLPGLSRVILEIRGSWRLLAEPQNPVVNHHGERAQRKPLRKLNETGKSGRLLLRKAARIKSAGYRCEPPRETRM